MHLLPRILSEFKTINFVRHQCTMSKEEVLRYLNKAFYSQVPFLLEILTSATTEHTFAMLMLCATTPGDPITTRAKMDFMEMEYTVLVILSMQKIYCYYDLAKTAIFVFINQQISQRSSYFCVVFPVISQGTKGGKHLAMY